MNDRDRRFVLVTPGVEVTRNERGELSTDGVIGVVTGDNAYVRAYPALADGEPNPSTLDVGQRSRGAKYSLSGTVGHYDIVRVA
jgi:hypothetical protein